MNIYTKTGDNGTTALATGERVAKHHPRVEAYGEIDELSAHLGLLASLQIAENQQTLIKHVQSLLMQCSATLADSPNDSHFITPKDIQLIENEIDTLQQDLPPLRGFILPGGGAAASHCHIARCVCRRAERRCVAVADNSAPYNNILRLLNRLSDYLFVLARTLCLAEGKEEAWAKH